MKKLLLIALAFTALQAHAHEGDENIVGYWKNPLVSDEYSVDSNGNKTITGRIHYGDELVKVSADGILELTQVLFNKGSDQKAKMQVDRTQLIPTQNEGEFTGKTIASSCAGLDPHIKDYDGKSALLFASWGQLKVIAREKGKLYVADFGNRISEEEYTKLSAKAYKTAQMVCMNENIQDVPSKIREVK